MQISCLYVQIQAPHEFFFSIWFVPKSSETNTHAQKHKDWAELLLFLHFYEKLILFFAYLLLNGLLIWYLMLSFLYFDKGAFCSQTFQCPVVFFFAISLHIFTGTTLEWKLPHQSELKYCHFACNVNVFDG